ncbi:hypothetical protein BpHYR1_035811 [Brachionus plicatilis]|uniref:Uncharacterized protein n=1 Tax=Brachionus plicatilis TaxID=10195 RepID=A0A3M7RH58_BRAPC|nr:hypothetical protein BpHYR1_035811 [Brachionus plicatilis]
MLIDICGSYRNKWRIKINPSKTYSVFHLIGSDFNETNQMEYLGFILDPTLPYRHPTSSPKFKSFVYKKYFLSKFTYDLETLTLNLTTKDSINK